MRRAGDVWRLGLVEYEDGVHLMDTLVPRRIAGDMPDTLFLLEHPHTITLGRRARPEHILLGPEAAVSQGVRIIETRRGGDVTYHGPGQIVGYPILNLRPGRCDAHRYVRNLEEVIIRTLAEYDLEADRIPGLTGVWVGQEKIAAIGVHLKRWVTSHGFALNVNTDLRGFSWIVPCGISDKGVTSLQALLGRPVPLSEVETHLTRHFADVFETHLTDRESAVKRSVQIPILRSRPTGWEALALRRVPAKGGFWQPVTGHIEAGEAPATAAAREALEETGLEGHPRSLDYIHRFAIDPDIAPTLPVPMIYEEHSYWMEADGPLRLDPSTHDQAEWLPVDEARRRMRWPGNREGVALAARAAGATSEETGP